MLLFTWNIHRKSAAFPLALEYMRRCNESFIACLQELPPQAQTTAVARASTMRFVGDRVLCLGVTPAGSGSTHGRVGLFCSPTLRPEGGDVDHDDHQRMATIFVLGARVEPLLVIGYHGKDRLNYQNRGTIGALSRQAVDQRWGQQPLIMLGDFNANPFDAEVCGSDGLFALRDRADARSVWASSLRPLGEKQRPLFNPMWSLLPEDERRPAGTLFADDHKEMLRWRLYDQILLSPDLIDKVEGSPTILTKIVERPLLNPNGSIDLDVSDHLPVTLRVDI